MAMIVALLTVALKERVKGAPVVVTGKVASKALFFPPAVTKRSIPVKSVVLPAATLNILCPALLK